MKFSIKDINNRRLNNMVDSIKEYSEGHDFYWEFDEDILEDGIHSVGAMLPDSYNNIEDRKNMLEDNIWMSIVMLNRLYNREQIKEDDKRQAAEKASAMLTEKVKANEMLVEYGTTMLLEAFKLEIDDNYIQSANIIFRLDHASNYIMTKSVFPNEKLYNIVSEETIDNYLDYYKKVLLLDEKGSVLDANFDLE